jgi:hypothetical protein
MKNRFVKIIHILIGVSIVCMVIVCLIKPSRFMECVSLTRPIPFPQTGVFVVVGWIKGLSYEPNWAIPLRIVYTPYRQPFGPAITIRTGL